MSTAEPSGGKTYKVVSGIGAGAGAALAMMAVMGLLRYFLALPTVPELMLGPILRLLGGAAFSAALDHLYYAGRPLLFTLALEGTLLLGVLLGLLYAYLVRPNPSTGQRPSLLRRPLGGLLYGLAIGLLLNTVFLPILGEAPFASRATEVYSHSPLPLWTGLMLLALVFGVTLDLLLPSSLPAAAIMPVTISQGGRVAYLPVEVSASGNRRQFLRIAGGSLLALLGGALFWGGGTVLNQGGLTSPVDNTPADNTASSDVTQDTPTPATVSQVEPTQPPPTEIPPTQARPTQPPTEPTEAPPTQPPAPTGTPQPPPTEAATPAEASQPTATLEAVPPPPPPTATAQPTQPPAPPATPTPQPVIAQATSTPPAPAPVSIAVREITPLESFYHVSKNFFDPSPSSGDWALEIKGLVSKRYTLTYAQLTAMPATTVTVGMMCISNPIGGALIGNQTWKGVRLADLLAKAKPMSRAVDALFTAEDGYTDSIPVQKALDPNVMLVWEMGGQPLPSEHGGPARLLVPGIYGMKHVKWLNSIELVGYDYRGYWQQPSQGWSDPAPVNTMSRIDFPSGTIARKKQVVSGIAFAGDRSISRVEVSADGGATWGQAYLKLPLSSTSWAVWGYEWTPPRTGKYTLQVRATDGKGSLQSARRTDPYPNGATGYHTVTVQVK